jgi:hypothetical protein
MPELIPDFITSLDGYASAEGSPGWWGPEGPECLAWLGERPERDNAILMGANTYRLTRLPKAVFSSTLEAQLTWANTRLVSTAPANPPSDTKRTTAGWAGRHPKALGRRDTRHPRAVPSAVCDWLDADL